MAKLIRTLPQLSLAENQPAHPFRFVDWLAGWLDDDTGMMSNSDQYYWTGWLLLFPVSFVSFLSRSFLLLFAHLSVVHHLATGETAASGPIGRTNQLTISSSFCLLSWFVSTKNNNNKFLHAIQNVAQKQKPQNRIHQ